MRSEFHAFNVNRSALRQFLLSANETDPNGGNQIVSVDLIDEVGYVVVVCRRYPLPIVIERLRSFERTNGWGLDA